MTASMYFLKAVEEVAAGKLDESDKQVVKDKCAAEMAWLDSNTLAEKEEYEHRLKELQKVCGPIMAKMHSGGTAGPQTAGSQASGAGNKGPTVEEVD